ncbi:MAG: type II/IV secretion system ATPase subunit [Thermoplasmatales archaeon]|nr:MAG: type II/IV secretion system ATPase subunit [Thermoplasmatales archaeon]
MKDIVASSSKVGNYSIYKKMAFFRLFNNKKMKTKKRNENTIHPSKKIVKFENELISIEQNINDPYQELIREIEDSLRNQDLNSVMKNEFDYKPQEKINVPPTEQIKTEGNIEKKLIDEKTGFGWSGLGSSRIVFDNRKKEYIYEIEEPILDNSEEAIKERLTYWFRIRADLDVFDLNQKEKMQYLEETLNKIMGEHNIKIQPESKNKIFYHIFRDFLGYGKIDILMHDEDIEDISCDGHDIPIFIFHKTYESIPSNIIFYEGDTLDSFVVKLSQLCGKQISVYEPVVDGKLSDGSRLQTTLARTITQHSTFTIRKFRENPLTPIDLIANNTMSVDMAAYFWMAIEQSSSILFCGGTATGKTTMLNALSLFLPLSYKIVSIEDTREINLPHENWIAGTTRKGFSSTEAAKTAKDIDMFDLIRVALRQRPRAIIVGEVRGKEAYTLFQAMTTGHLSYSTVHASNLHALIQRLENPPISLPRNLLTSLDLVVFLNAVTIKGAPLRRITNVTEIIKLDPETNRLVTMTPFRWVSEIDDRFETNGGSSIITKIKKQNGWNDDELNQELNNRITILNWMKRKNLRSYEEVGNIVSEYRKDPKSVLERAREDN